MLKMNIESNDMQINIKKAVLENILINCVDYNGKALDIPEISMSIRLMTQAGSTITSVGLGTGYARAKELKDLPLAVYDRIGDIVAMLMPQAVVKLNGVDKLISGEVSNG